MIPPLNVPIRLLFLRLVSCAAMLLFNNQVRGQYNSVSIFNEGNEQITNPSKIGLNYNLKDVDQLILNYNKQWVDLPIGPKNLAITYNKIISNFAFAASIKTLDFGGAFNNIQCIIGGRYKLKISNTQKIIFGISGIAGQLQGDFANTTILNVDDPNFFSFNNQRYIDGGMGITYICGSDKKFSIALAASKNSIASVLGNNPNFDNGWETSSQIINNYNSSNLSTGFSLYSLKGILRNTYGIGQIIQIETDFGIHFSQNNQILSSLQTQNFRVGAYYGYDLTNSQFNAFGIRISFNPQNQGKSAFGGLGYSVLALGKSGAAGNNVGSFVGFQKAVK
jgi:hypothetical protein